MSVQLESVTFTSGTERRASRRIWPLRIARAPSVVLILRGVAGPDDGTRRLRADSPSGLRRPGTRLEGSRSDPTDEHVYADLHGAMTFLGSVDQADLTKLTVFGFCRGGVTRSWRLERTLRSARSSSSTASPSGRRALSAAPSRTISQRA